jgi:probable F420-dependent oxidoreductase
MATFDAFALATAVGLSTQRVALSIGPLAVAVRTPVTVAMGVASVAELTGRRVNVALGTSSDVVVEEWHGRRRSPSVTALLDHARTTAALLRGDRSDGSGEVVTSRGYRLRLPAVPTTLTVAAFGPRTIRAAAAIADRLVLNMLTPATAGRLVERFHTAAAALRRPRPRTAIWLAAAVDPQPATLEQIARGSVGYLAAPGYGEMFAEAGFGELVEFARRRPHPRELLAAIPSELISAVALVGTVDEVRARIDAYRDVGIDEVCLVPATAGDDHGARTLTALAP